MGVSETTYSQQGGRTMANIDVTLNPELLPNLLSDSGEGMKKLVESVLNQVLEAQMVDHLGADRHERSDRLSKRISGTTADDAGRNPDSPGSPNPGRKLFDGVVQTLPAL
jgi:hypothetical protein